MTGARREQTMFRSQRSTLGAGFLVFAALTLSACGPAAPAPQDDDDSPQTSAEESSSDGDDGEDSGEDSGDESMATFAGTGVYTIGDDVPYGGFQMQGEPAPVPDGCTWSIQDESGAIVVENQGAYAFLTDVPEYVTFHTDGCPEWEQFE
ncbi:hypothetical protein [Microbacterium sp. PMB16]|uniref:hypothetical protein n=1 Tax=Microbacterium sp. PMB16 TaxID=3120157 RepID=UPI003F4B8760